MFGLLDEHTISWGVNSRNIGEVAWLNKGAGIGREAPYLPWPVPGEGCHQFTHTAPVLIAQARPIEHTDSNGLGHDSCKRTQAPGACMR